MAHFRFDESHYILGFCSELIYQTVLIYHLYKQISNQLANCLKEIISVLIIISFINEHVDVMHLGWKLAI